MKKILTIFVLFIFVSIVTSKNAGETAPDFRLFDLAGKKHNLYDIIKSLPENGFLILNFTSIYCLPCEKEIPDLVRLEKSGNGKFKLLCVFAECCKPAKEKAVKLRVFEKSLSDPFEKVKPEYSVTSFPVTFIINKKHLILGRYDGYSSKNMIEIEKILFGK
jgi:thiol-disulfide isomerase/thioredoxin